MRKHRIPSRLFSLLVYIFLYAPIVLLIVFSFNATKSNRVWGGFSLDWYVELFHNTRLLGALRTTIILSVLAAFIATILGTAAAIGFYSMRRRSRSICLSVNNIPLTNADIITGVSGCSTAASSARPWASAGRWALVPCSSPTSPSTSPM